MAAAGSKPRIRKLFAFHGLYTHTPCREGLGARFFKRPAGKAFLHSSSRSIMGVGIAYIVLCNLPVQPPQASVPPAKVPCASASQLPVAVGWTFPNRDAASSRHRAERTVSRYFAGSVPGKLDRRIFRRGARFFQLRIPSLCRRLGL